MASAKMKKGDTVVVLSGKDKGKTGTVSQVMPRDGKLIVSGVNMMTRHRKPSQANPEGGRDRVEAAMAVSKVAVADPKSGAATRVRFEMRDGKKVRVAVKSGELING
jgi:large subunit ribosomal protein L24